MKRHRRPPRRRAIHPSADLTDPAWKTAARIDRFYETAPADNTVPRVKTTAWLTYDDRYFYVAIRCDDPDAKKHRAPYVERDNVIGTDDKRSLFFKVSYAIQR